jgi:uncharacterized protein YkwD
MKTMRMLAVILTVVMTASAGTAIIAETNASVENTPKIQLIELVTKTPDITETRNTRIMVSQKMTEIELETWIDEYWELGGINTYEIEVVRLINIEREKAGLSPLALSPKLSMAARFHSQEMADLQYFNHISPIYGRATNRANMFGHENEQEWVFGVSENLHGAAISPERAVQNWMNSPGHRRAILNPNTLSIGVGATRTNEHGSGNTVAVFGA